jgi:hypothetical protein
MKYAAVLLVCAAFVMSSVPAVAGDRDMLKTDVPFDFTINNKMFAAGHYTIERLSGENIGTLIIRGVDPKEVMTFQTFAGEAQSGAPFQLEFAHQGDTYSLITVQGALATYSLAPTRLRREIAKHSDVTAVQATP